MFIHLEIFFCIFTLMLGSWVVYDTFRLSRTTSQAFLKPIALFILFYNLSIFMRLVSQYTCANILASCFIFNASIYSKVLAPFAFMINIGMTASMGAAVLALLGKRLSPKWKRWIITVIAVTIGSYTTRIFLSSHLNLLPWLPLFNQYIYLAVVFVAYAFLVYLLIGVRAERNPERTGLVRVFAVFYLCAYSSLILSFLFRPVLQYFFVVVVHLLFNLFLIFWLRHSFFPYHAHSISSMATRGVLDGFFKKHSISKREKEIAELILQGKSNKDIEHQLFISPHTVKNHIYNLYQKTGVKSRGQLVSRMLESNHRQQI